MSRGLFPDCTAADLSRGFVGRTRFPFLLTRFAADDSATTQSYFLPSERFLYVLNGELSLHTTATDSPSQLQAGDAVYIPEFQPHWITSRNRTTKAITVLWDLQGVRPQALYTRGGMRLSHKTNADAVTRNSLDGDSEYWRMVGLRIQALRTRCGLTQELLAELCGLPDSELRQIESGRRAPSLEKLLVIGSMLRVSDLSDLLTDLAVDIVPAQPTEADSAAIAQLSAQLNRSLPQVVYVVKVQLKSKPPATSLAWRLYVNDELIPKYWEYDDGIYFTVLDPQFLADHKGQRLRFSLDGVEFYDTGLKLPAAATPAASKTKGKARKGKAAKSKADELPLQADVLK